MAKTKQQKVEMVGEVTSALKGAISAVFVGFTKLSVANETAMRRALRDEKVGYTVVKKTLARRALESLGHDAGSVVLDGQVAVAYGNGDDSTAPARLVYDFGKKLAGSVVILGGIFEGKLVGKAGMEEIATIPSLDVLRGMFANVINSPRARFAIALSEVAKTRQS